MKNVEILLSNDLEVKFLGNSLTDEHISQPYGWMDMTSIAVSGSVAKCNRIVCKTGPVGKESNNSPTVRRKITTNDAQNDCRDIQAEWHGVSHG